MAKPDRIWWSHPPAILTYGIATVSIAGALMTARWLEDHLVGAPVALFLCAIMLSAWFGGSRPGLLAAALSFLSFKYYFVAPAYSLSVDIDQAPRLLLFAMSALFVWSLSSAQRRTSETLRRARDELDVTVQELKRLNEALLIENAERNRAEEVLRRSEAFLAEAQRISRTGSWSWNIPTRKVTWSAEHYRIFGFDAAGGPEPTLKSVLKRVHPEDRPLVRQILEGSIRVGWQFTFEFRAALPDGSTTNLLATGRPLSKDSGEIDEYIGTTVDITERKRGEVELAKAFSELKKSEAQLRTIIDTIPTQAWCWLADGSSEFQNQRWLDYTGLSTEETRGWGWTKALHPEDAERCINKWRKIHASELAGETEARFRRFDGEYRWFLMRVVPLRDEHGDIIKWYGTNTDIQDLKRSEDALRNTQSELARVARLTTMGELTASIAHEVNQPLGAIVANGEAGLRWLRRDPPDLDRVHVSMEAMIGDGNRASAVISRIRGLAKKASSQKALMDINDVIQEVILLVEREMQVHVVSLRLDLAPTLPPVLGDRVALQQVIINLIMNSVEAMSTVTGRPRALAIFSQPAEPAEVIVTLRDTGVGIDAAIADRIFDPFFTTKFNGIGMGLSICRSIIEAHGGRLGASPNVSGGATFRFTLPLAERISHD
ncbi:PAS domain-containing protein [Methylocapsa polymorpha]|uniref:histidine kinase n=1 Tax=Methylocapsa polymorpha TaxID=3080828 RepID=A0ABZ0HQ88_9HYPH|nr:PAS domain-containing protein [Methylocapsa sp. RX1]